jgi:hypothetical protein
MHLNHRQINRQNGIINGQTIMSIGSRIDNDTIGCIHGLMQFIDDFAFGIGLENIKINLPFFDRLLQTAVDIFQSQ